MNNYFKAAAVEELPLEKKEAPAAPTCNYDFEVGLLDPVTTQWVRLVPQRFHGSHLVQLWILGTHMDPCYPLGTTDPHISTFRAPP